VVATIFAAVAPVFAPVALVFAPIPAVLAAVAPAAIVTRIPAVFAAVTAIFTPVAAIFAAVAAVFATIPRAPVLAGMAPGGDCGAVRTLRGGGGALRSYGKKAGGQQRQHHPSVSHLSSSLVRSAPAPLCNQTRGGHKGCEQPAIAVFCLS
jgi:hypothetical protein